MSFQKIYIVSPNLPAGASWLVNCFLELGIKTYRTSPEKEMWLGQDGCFSLHPREHVLKKWFPALARQESFVFREGVEAEWTHEWPKKKFEDGRIIYFIRDPRDAIYSLYTRSWPEQTFHEFANFPDPETLLNPVENWLLFNWCWLLSSRDLLFVKFEDYKKDSKAVLRFVLDSFGLKFPEADIHRVVEESTSEQAAESEKRYIGLFPEDKRRIHQGGRSGRWREDHEAAEGMSEIEKKTWDWLRFFGYAEGPLSREALLKTADLSNYALHLCFLPFFSDLSLDTHPWLKTGSERKGETCLANQLVQFVYSLDDAVLAKCGLRDYEKKNLIRSLSHFFWNFGGDVQKKLAVLSGSPLAAPAITAPPSPLAPFRFPIPNGHGSQDSWVLRRVKSKLSKFIHKIKFHDDPDWPYPRGTVYWLTGLAGSGKTTIGKSFYARLRDNQPNVIFLDGDELREVVSDDLDHGPEDRKKSAIRNSRLCKLLSDQGFDVVCCTISLWHDCHRWNRENIRFYKEIYIRAPLPVLVARDTKGLYRRAFAGKLKNLWGVDLKPEEPLNPDVLVDNDGSETTQQIADRVFDLFFGATNARH